MPRKHIPGLVLASKVGERVIIENGRIVITVVSCGGGKARLHFAADRSIPINRDVIQDHIDAERGTQLR